MFFDLLVFNYITLSLDSVGLRLKFFDAILESLPKIFVCVFWILIIAFSFRVTGPRII